jgi:hypothetical protein
VSTFTRGRLAVIPAILLGLVTACGSDETAAPPDHTPVTYNLIINNIPVTEPYTLPAGQTVPVRIKFFNAAGEDLDDVEAEHFGALTFNPTSLATVQRLTGTHYQFDVTAGSVPGSGVLIVSFGHGEDADEVSFDPATVNVTGGGQN